MLKHIFIILAAATCLAIGQAGFASADVNNFYISDYQIDFQLSRDKDGHSLLGTTERIVAQFPNYAQNHGIERIIPTRYDGHSTNLKIQSVTDDDGRALTYKKLSNTSDSINLRIGDADQYVMGEKTYVIKYSQQDVTKYFEDNNSDEFYWDTNGTDWQVPISKLTINLTVDQDTAGHLNGNKACYVGQAGSATTCSIDQDQLSGAATFATTTNHLNYGENVTIAIGFNKDTFAVPVLSLGDKISNLWQKIQPIWFILTFVSMFMLVPVIIILSYYLDRLSKRTNELKPIPVEYIPPKNVSVSTSGQIFGNYGRTDTAQMVDLAVRHYIKIYQISSGAWIFKSKDYEIEIVKPLDDLLPEEKEMLNDMFDRTPVVGDRLALKTLRLDYKFTTRLSDNVTKFKKLAEDTYHLRADSPRVKRKLRVLALVFLILGVLTLGILFGVIALVFFIASFTIRPLTDKGLVLYRYLRGLKMYIGAAEKRRFAMLQSPDGVEKTQIDPNDSKAMLKLYERNLPYAILFGQEKEWYKAIGKYYEDTATSPSWFIGAAGVTFSASSFSSAMSSFSSSSSSSSGSSGGGSSGGGGGGGGGGGW